MTHPTIEAWFAQSNGKPVNPDKSYGLQCKDTIDDYGQYLFGVPWTQCVGGANAKDVPNVAPSEYWVWTANDYNKPNQIPQRGDVIVWGGNTNNVYGHIAVVVSATTSVVKVLQQDGGAEPKVLQTNADGSQGYYSMKPIHTFDLYYDNLYTGPVLGWLTPRENKIKTKEVSNMGYEYKLHTQWTSPNRSPRSAFGYVGKPNAIVLHWWNTPENAGSFEGTVSWLCNPQAQVSAHYVVSGKNIACIVSPDEAAWHTGTTQYNGSSIGIEIDPRLPAGTMESVYQLCFELEKTYGSMSFYGHKDVNPGTACPGIIYNKIPEVINKVNALHKSGGKTTTTTKPTPAKVEPKMTLTQADVDKIVNSILDKPIDRQGAGITGTTTLRKEIAWNAFNAKEARGA